MVRSSSVLSILTWKCDSRHNGVHFFMSHLASWLRTRRFSEPTFRPSGATNHWRNTVNRDFPIFSRIYLFFLLIFSLLSASSLLCVSTVHIVGSLASKLPSIILVSPLRCQVGSNSSARTTLPKRGGERFRSFGFLRFKHHKIAMLVTNAPLTFLMQAIDCSLDIPEDELDST